MTFDEYEKLKKQTRDMIFKLYIAHCDANRVKKVISKDWYRWLKEDFNIKKTPV